MRTVAILGRSAGSVMKRSARRTYADEGVARESDSRGAATWAAAMGVCRACVIVTEQGNARVCREGPVLPLGDVRFAEGEPATVGLA